MTENDVDPIHESASPRVADQIAVFLRTEGREPIHPSGAPLVLLTTRGRHSGVLRRTMLLHGVAGEDLIVVGSAGGRETHPDWYLNAAVDDSVLVQRGPGVERARAVVTSGDDRARLWRDMLDVFPDYRELQTRTTRLFPVVRLRPIADHDGRRPSA